MKTNKQRPLIASRLFNRLALIGMAATACLITPRANAADIDYVLTAPTDPVKPGHVFEFDVTVRNLTAVSQPVTLSFTVPEGTTYGSHGAGTPESYGFGDVAAGASETAQLRFTVVGAPPPPDET